MTQKKTVPICTFQYFLYKHVMLFRSCFSFLSIKRQFKLYGKQMKAFIFDNHVKHKLSFNLIQLCYDMKTQ